MATKEIRAEAVQLMRDTTQSSPSWWHASYACSMCSTADSQRSAGLIAQADESERVAREHLAAAKA